MLADIVSLDTPVPAAPVADADLTFDAPTMASSEAHEVSAEGGDTDKLAFTAPMSRPPESAVTPVPGLADATVLAEEVRANEATVFAHPAPVAAPPIAVQAPREEPKGVDLAVAKPDAALAWFETLDRRVRPLTMWVLFGLAAGVGIAEAFDSAIGSYPIFRTLVGSSRVDLQACKLEYSIVSPK